MVKAGEVMDIIREIIMKHPIEEITMEDTNKEGEDLTQKDLEMIISRIEDSKIIGMMSRKIRNQPMKKSMNLKKNKK